MYLAQIIARTFFPPDKDSKTLLATFVVFMLGYFSRPLGSLLIGLFADQIGRKKALIYSILITGGCTAAIGLIPSYQTIGNTALSLFFLLRILQNISVGGEYISSISYLIESASENKRGFYGSWVSVGFNCGTLLASLTAYLTIVGMDNHYIPDWSWRVIFLFALIGTAVGFWIRSSLPESLGYILNNASTHTLSKLEILKSSINLIKNHPLRCLALMSIGWLGVSQTSAVFIYSPIHMTTINHLSQEQSLQINTLSLVLLTLLIPFFGYCCDKVNRIKLLMIATITFMLYSPIYFYYLSYGSYIQVLITKVIFSIPSACYYAMAPVLITESFPVNIRCTSLALIYQTITSIAGGVTPIILLRLSKNHHIHWSPSLYIIVSGIICIAGLYYLHKYGYANFSKIPSWEGNIIRDVT